MLLGSPSPPSDSLIVAIGSTSPVSVSRKTTSLLGLLPLTTASLQLGSPSFLHGLQLLLTPAGAACPAQLLAVFALHPIWPLQILFMGFVHILSRALLGALLAALAGFMSTSGLGLSSDHLT